MKRLIPILVLAACGSQTTAPDAGRVGVHRDGAVDGDGNLLVDAPAVDASTDASIDAPPSYTCSFTDTTAGDACCIFGSTCGAGLSCYWQALGDYEPTQRGQCATTGTTPVDGGAACDVVGNPTCAAGEFCDNGTCKQLCDPNGADVPPHGCPTGKTCRPMVYVMFDPNTGITTNYYNPEAHAGDCR